MVVKIPVAVSWKNKPSQPNLRSKLGMKFEKVGGLDAQLDTIVRRVLASRANPEAARRLGILHVRGILLRGPPGYGKTLLVRQFSGLLGALHIYFFDERKCLE